MSEPIRETLREHGVHVEPRETSAMTRMVASSAGSVAGQLLAKTAGLGPWGAAAAGIGGALLGYLASSHRVVLEPPPEGDPDPESPMTYSDRS